MRKYFTAILFCTLIYQIGYSQNNSSNQTNAKSKAAKQTCFELFPSGLNFMPLKAGIDEARMGLLYYTATTNMKVDIGNSVDVFGFNFPESKSKITVGAEFMAYAYVTSYLAYRLQIDAVDGFFGGNVVYSKSLNNGRFVTRFRYIHSSAHLVDGHWDNSTDEWLDNQLPEAYGNNYGELLFAREEYLGISFLRYYAGLSMSTGKKTGERNLKRFLYKGGFEYSIPNLLGKVFDKDESIFVAVNFDVRGIPEYIVNQNYLLGIKFGDWQGKGLVFYASYYNGGDVFNQYFNYRVSRFGIGFMFDFI